MLGQLYLASAIIFTCLAGLLLYSLLARENPRGFTRLMQVTRPAANIAVEQDTRGIKRLAQGSAKAAAWIRAHAGFREDSSLRERLGLAGAKSGIAGDLYLTARFLGPLLGLAAGSFLPGPRSLWLTALPTLAYLFPDLLLGRAIRRRRERFRLGIPDVIDLLVICVDAGLGLDQALQRVGLELAMSHPAVQDEFLTINREQRAGRPRAEAWQAMAARIQLEEVNALVSMLMQTEKFGTPIAKALATFAAGIRLKRRQQAEEKAAKTTIKIIFPLVLFIFPAIFIVLLGPAALKIIRSMSGHGF